MLVKRILVGLAIFFAAGGAMAAYVMTPKVHAGRTGESPELGGPGGYAIGTVLTQVTLPQRGHITASSALSGTLAIADRTLPVRYWYPAAAGTKGKPAHYDHAMQLPGHPPFHLAGRRRLLRPPEGAGAWPKSNGVLGIRCRVRHRVSRPERRPLYHRGRSKGNAPGCGPGLPAGAETRR